MRLREFATAKANSVQTADAQRVKQLKANAKRAQKTATIAQQQATIKKGQEKLAKARKTPAVIASL